jgi:hypothetical protein
MPPSAPDDGAGEGDGSDAPSALGAGNGLKSGGSVPAGGVGAREPLGRGVTGAASTTTVPRKPAPVVSW